MAGNRPTQNQLKYLRALAQQKGQTFAYPATFEQASAEIERLKAADFSTGAERERDRAEVGRHGHPLLSAVRVRAHEIQGWGSTCRWAG